MRKKILKGIRKQVRRNERIQNVEKNLCTLKPSSKKIFLKVFSELASNKFFIKLFFPTLFVFCILEKLQMNEVPKVKGHFGSLGIIKFFYGINFQGLLNPIV